MRFILFVFVYVIGLIITPANQAQGETMPFSGTTITFNEDDNGITLTLALSAGTVTYRKED